MTSVSINEKQSEIIHTEGEAVMWQKRQWMTGGIRPQVKAWGQPPEAEGAQNRFSLTHPEGSQPCRHLDSALVILLLEFWPPECENYISVVLSHWVCSYSSHKKLMHYTYDKIA